MTAAEVAAMPLADALAHYRACSEAAAWAAQYRTAAEAWDACRRPDWLLWSLDRIGFRDDPRLRLFACWCARNTPLPDGRTTWDLLTDERSRRAVEVAERYARGEATDQELAAARAAAWDAARAAAWDAARAAARAATWAAAGDAARAAAGDAAGAAARAAAGDAAGAAAWAAARAAAWAADRAAAGDADRAAAGDAAGAAAAKAQADALRTILGNPFAAPVAGESTR